MEYGLPWAGHPPSIGIIIGCNANHVNVNKNIIGIYARILPRTTLSGRKEPILTGNLASSSSSSMLLHSLGLGGSNGSINYLSDKMPLQFTLSKEVVVPSHHNCSCLRRHCWRPDHRCYTLDKEVSVFDISPVYLGANFGSTY